jgi:tetratricopeptide (TPR) repeat protein
MKAGYITHCILGLALFALLPGCQSEQGAAKKEIEALETSLSAAFDPVKADSLLARYDAYGAAYPEDLETLAAFRLNGAKLLAAAERQPQAAQQLLKGLQLGATASTRPAALLLAQLYEKHLDQPDAALTARQALAVSHPDAVALPAGEPAFLARMDGMLQQITVDSAGSLNFKAAGAYIANAEVYAAIAHKDKVAPQVLYKAAEVARAVRSYQKALSFYDWISTRYPDDERAPKALFMQAFTYDEDLNDDEAARRHYQAFLERYPNDDFADDAALLIENLGKTEAEIIKQLEQKAAGQ